MTWTSNTKYVDIETGEQLTRGKPKEYIIIKTNKNVQINYKQGRGHIQYTKQCRRNPQQTIKFPD